jgi:hypothetical protein
LGHQGASIEATVKDSLLTIMDERAYKYLKERGVDLNDNSHPFAREYNNVSKLNNSFASKSFEHLILKLILDLKIIEQYSKSDYEYFIKRIKKKDTSFWGERFEIYWYSSLIEAVKTTITELRHGEPPHEPDFLFRYEGKQLGMEITTVSYEDDSSKSDPIGKIRSRITKKEGKSYATDSCCLIIDISNLSFHRKLHNNFRITISEMVKDLKSTFGVVLFCESYHVNQDGNPRYITQAYDWVNPYVQPELLQFISLNERETDQSTGEKLTFKVG